MGLKEYVVPGGATYKFDEDDAKRFGGLPNTAANRRKMAGAGRNKIAEDGENKSDGGS